MDTWVITYNGIVVHYKTNEKVLVKAKFNFKYNPLNTFYYQLMWDEIGASRAMSRKVWDNQFWTDLRKQNQERYASQAKEVNGYIQFLKTPSDLKNSNKDNHKNNVELLNSELNNEQNIIKTIDLPILAGSRDHNFGIRNWRYMWRYIWWSPVKFDYPITIDGIDYTYILGSFVEYGNTFENMVIGGIMSEQGDCASFSSATSMENMAKEWYHAESKHYVGIGEKTLPKEFNFYITLLKNTYVLDINIIRGRPAGLWSHSFMMGDGTFEIHEGQSKWTFNLRKIDQDTGKFGPILQTTYAVGLFEFGGNLIGLDASD